MNAYTNYDEVKVSRLVAFVQSHGNKVVSHTETTITAQCEESDGTNWTTVTETFPATLQACRDWLGY